MNVKAQGLLHAAKYIEDTFGRDALGEVLRACSPAVRDTYTTATVINWHPVEELEFCEVAEKRMGRHKLIEEIGAAGAHANMKGVLLRIAFYWGRPDYLMKRAAGLWRQFNDEGSMVLLHMDARLVQIEVTGILQPRATFCRIITGWCQEVAGELGVKNVHAVHTQCRARGDERCLFEVRGIYDGPIEMET